MNISENIKIKTGPELICHDVAEGHHSQPSYVYQSGEDAFRIWV